MERAQQLAKEPLVREARNELTELDARIAKLEALFVSDPDFGRAHVDALREAFRRPDRPVD